MPGQEKTVSTVEKGVMTIKEVADQLSRNFLIVLVLAFVGEILLRLSPSILKDATERVWLEWLLVSLIGVCAYLLWNAAIWHKRSWADFVAYRPWYRATAARGPIIALVVLIALTNINFQVSLSVLAICIKPVVVYCIKCQWTIIITNYY